MDEDRDVRSRGCREFMLIRPSPNFRIIKLNWLPLAGYTNSFAKSVKIRRENKPGVPPEVFPNFVILLFINLGLRALLKTRFMRLTIEPGLIGEAFWRIELCGERQFILFQRNSDFWRARIERTLIILHKRFAFERTGRKIKKTVSQISQQFPMYVALFLDQRD